MNDDVYDKVRALLGVLLIIGVIGGGLIYTAYSYVDCQQRGGVPVRGIIGFNCAKGVK